MTDPEKLSDLELRDTVGAEVFAMKRHDYSADKGEFPRCKFCGETAYHGERRDGWCYGWRPDYYESEAAAAMAVVAKMRELGFGAVLHAGPKEDWSCDFTKPNPGYDESRKRGARGSAKRENPKYLVCQADHAVLPRRSASPPSGRSGENLCEPVAAPPPKTQ